jgi:NAD(P)-dependent dehydrogenase (short-subunit alcohol dehydrogenase family)
MINATVERYGTIHILVNNAGIGLYKSVMETTSEDWDRCLGINLKGAFLCSKYAIPPSGLGKRFDCYITPSTHISSSVKHPTLPVKGLRPDPPDGVNFGKDHIRANAVCPGWITPNVQRFDRRPDQ